MPINNLAGKIPDEVSLFYAGPDTNEKMHTHSYVSEDILRWFYSIFDHYLKWNKTRGYIRWILILYGLMK